MTLFRIIFAFLPASVQLLVFGLFAIFLIIIAFKVVGMVLDAIPFL